MRPIMAVVAAVFIAFALGSALLVTTLGRQSVASVARQLSRLSDPVVAAVSGWSPHRR